jgi:hypothetical protein
MAPDDPSGARPAAPVVLRIKLRYDSVDVMIQRFAPNVGKTGLFLPTRSLQPIGVEVKFELRLANETPVLIGHGRVKGSREPDPTNPKATFGLAVELLRVTRESRDLILKILERRKQLGMPEIGIPMPADIDSARRSDFVDSGIKDVASGPVPVLIPASDSAPTSGPVLTAPRRTTGPIAVAKATAAVEPLAPEPPRRKRVPVAELIASASGPVAYTAVDGLDDDVDVAAALARARTLAAGTDLDGDLEALRDLGAAPIAIDVEAASAELARQLGGAAVRRDRSGARWAPPPPTNGKSEPLVEEASPEPVRDEAEPTPIMAEPAPSTLDDDVPEVADGLFERPRQESFAPAHAAIATEPSTPALIHDDADPAQFEGAAGEWGGDEHEVEPEQIHDEIHRLDEGDYEEVEHTQIGQLLPVDPDAFDQHAFATLPSEDPGMADRLDAELEQAEQEAAADDLGLSSETLAQAAADDSLVMALDEAAREAAQEDDIEEIDDFEILAEADVEDGDLLAADAEHDVGTHEAPDAVDDAPPVRPSFLSRLDLGEDSYQRPASERSLAEISPERGEIDPRVLSAGYALRAFEEPEDEIGDFNAPGTFTPIPQEPPAVYAMHDDDEDELDAPHGEYGASPTFVPPDAFDSSRTSSTRAHSRQG